MKINGQTDVREYGVAKLPRADGSVLELPIQSVGSEAELLGAHPCWHAVPKAEVLRDKKGAIVRDKDNQPVLAYNRESAEFKAKQAELSVLWAVAYIYLGLRQVEDGVSWDTDPEMMRDKPLDFFRSIQREMEEAGLSQGAQGELFRQIHELSVPTRKEVDAAKASFPDE